MGLLYSNYEGNNTVKINACSGGIYKTYKESWFSYLSLNGCAMKTMTKSYSYESDESPYYKNVIILQMILTNKDCVVAELIKKEDFDKYFVEEK